MTGKWNRYSEFAVQNQQFALEQLNARQREQNNQPEQMDARPLVGTVR